MDSTAELFAVAFDRSGYRLITIEIHKEDDDANEGTLSQQLEPPIIKIGVLTRQGIEKKKNTVRPRGKLASEARSRNIINSS